MGAAQQQENNGPPPRAGRSARGRGRVAGGAGGGGVWGVRRFLLVVISWGRITAPFGDSDEGATTGWGVGARPVPAGGVGAPPPGGPPTHGSGTTTPPPGIVIETTLAQLVGGDHPWSSRLPAVLGTIAAVVLIYRLLRVAGFEPLASGGAAALIALTPMALVYGPMLDTPVTAFPFGVLVLICWYRDWRGDRPVHPALAALAALAAGLSGWQAAVLTAMCGLALLARAVRRLPRGAPRSPTSWAAPWAWGCPCRGRGGSTATSTCCSASSAADRASRRASVWAT